MKKRILSTLLALALCLSLLPTAAFAERENDGSTETHTHCVCGKTHTVIGDHTEDSTITFTAWEFNTYLPASSGYYYLTDDVTLDNSLSKWKPADGTVLCLNGHTITSQTDQSVITINRGCTFTLTDCKIGNQQGAVTHDLSVPGGGNRCADVQGTFNMYGGKITGNKSYNGGGVYVLWPGKFNLYGGSIVDNHATEKGGGVYVYNGCFNMHGGTISKNTASSDGGGVSMENESDFTMSGGKITENTASGNGAGVSMDSSPHSITLSGDAQITGNTKTDDSTASNIYLSSGNTITLTEVSFTGLAGITTATAPTVPAPVQVLSGLEDYSSVTSKFTSDVNTKYHVNDSGKLVVDRCTGCVYENGVCTVCGYICPHSNVDTNNKCGECASAMIAKVEHTEGDTTTGYYASLNAAIEAARAGDTITLLANVNESVACTSKNITLDLNGKTLSSLTVFGTAIKVKDSVDGGKIGTLTTSNGVKVVDLLEAGYAFKATNGTTVTWYDKYNNSDATSITNVEVMKQWITGVTLTADGTKPDGEDHYTYTFGDTVKLTADVERKANDPAGIYYDWYKDDDTTPFKQTLYDTNHTENDTPNLCDYDQLSAGTHKIYVKVTTHSYTRTSAPITVIVNKATLTADDYTAPTANTLTYSGGGQELVSAGTVPPGCTVQYKLGESGTWSDSVPEAADAGTYNVYWYIDGGTNYQDVGSQGEPNGPIKVTIDRKPVEPAIVFADNKLQYQYTGSPIQPAFTLMDGTTAIDPSEYIVSYSGNTNVCKNAQVTVTCKDGGNYNFVAVTKAFEITKATLDPDDMVYWIRQCYADQSVQHLEIDLTKYGFPTGETITLSNERHNLPGDNCMYAQVDLCSVDGTTLKFDYRITGGTSELIGCDAHFYIDIESGNYNKTTLDITVKLTDKTQKDLTVTMDGWTYGDTPNAPQFSKPDGVEAQIKYQWQSPTSSGGGSMDNTISSDAKAGTWKVYVMYETDTQIWSGTADFTISPKNITGAPKYTAITTSGKTLADAALAVNENWPAGTVKWVDADGNELANTTTVAANTAYSWLFTPTDSTNYNTLGGTVTLWHKSSSGSSSSGSTVTVPISSDHATVEVKAEVSKGNATVEVSNKQIEKVAADGAGDVTIDVSGLKNVESATVPSHVVEKTNEAENTGLTVALPAGSVTLDETALGSVTENAKGKDVTVSVVSVPTANLSPVVKDIIGMEPTVLAVVDVDVTISGRKQSSFDGGKVTISVPYTPKAGEDTSKLTVWFIKDDGTIENKGGWYDAKNKCFVFETNHLSQYILVNTNEMQTFVDVPADAYFANAVSWAAGKGITGGVDATHFMPHNACTRAQIVTFLYRWAVANGVDVSVGEDTNILSYNDAFSIPEYAVSAFQWAVGTGIVQGNNGYLNPNLTCTRAQAVAFLFRFAAANGMDFVTLQELVSGYGDAAQVPSYALPAFNWALAGGIVQGNDGNLLPNQTCTRAQIVTMLYRLLGE